MNQQKCFANRFREVIFNGTWIANTNFKNELSSLDWKLANKSCPGFNSIAVLPQHIHYYINGINIYFKTGNLAIKDKYSFDFQDIQLNDEWNNFLNVFWTDASFFADFVESMADNDFEQVFFDAKYGTVSRNIDGMIEHCYYHLGQIVLIKKFFETSSNI